jgi:PKD repeat protein
VSGPGSTISGIDVSVPGGSGTGNMGIDTNGAIDNVIVHPASGQPLASSEVGVVLRAGASLTASDVLMALTQNGVAVQVFGPSVTIRGATLQGANGILVPPVGASATVQGVRIDFGGNPIQVANGDVTVDDSVMVHRADSDASPSGLVVNTSGTASLSVNHSTLVGSPSDNAPAFIAVSSGSGSASVSFRNGIATRFPVKFYRQATSSGPANITTDYSDYGGGAALFDTGPGTYTETNHLDVPPGFASATDFHLRPDSPLIDAADPSETGGLDGNGDCVARRDLGAFEFSPGPRAPHAVAVALPGALVVGTPTGFDASASCDPDGDALTYAWTFDDGTTATGATVQHAFARAGSHSATVTVQDATGRSASATAYVTTTAVPKPFTGVTIAKQTLKVSKKGVAKVKVKCPAAASGSCAGTLKLTAKLGKKRVGIGSRKFTIKRGATAAVPVKLAKPARARLRKNRRLHALATATAKDASGLTKVGTGTLVLLRP